MGQIVNNYAMYTTATFKFVLMQHTVSLES